MTLETETTKELLYANYRYEHCDGNCDSCPCYNEDYRCSYIHDEIRKELNSRGE